jgi:SAM domain (Sterile alpha motif)
MDSLTKLITTSKLLSGEEL